MSSLHDVSSEKTPEKIDKTILIDSLYHYQEFRLDKTLVAWIQNSITLFKENECVDLNKLKHHLEDAKVRADRLERPDIAQIIFNFENELIELEYDFKDALLPRDRLNTLIAQLKFNLNIQLYKPDQFLNRIKLVFPNFLDVEISSPLPKKPKHEIAMFAVFIVQTIHKKNHEQLKTAFELIESLLIEQQTLAKRALIIELLLELIAFSDYDTLESISAYFQTQTKLIINNLIEDWHHKYDEEYEEYED
jgi:hypothetical protein